MLNLGQIQLGKQGITDNFIKTLKDNFKKHENVRIHILKSAGHGKNKVKELMEDILKKLGNNYTAKVIGFTICIKRWRRAVSRKG